MKNTNPLFAGLLAITICSLGACLQPSDSDLLVSVSKPVQGNDIAKTLAAQSDFTLFYKAFLRAGMDKHMIANKEYTVFAITNTGMNAAGLDNGKVETLPLDSLTKLISYHVIDGALNDQSFINRQFSHITETMRSDTSFSQGTGYRLSAPLLYISGQGRLYLNDMPAGKLPSAISTFNGFIFPVDILVKPVPPRSLLDLLDGDPELSMFKTAMIIADSIRQAAVMEVWEYQESGTSDMYLFSDPGVNTVAYKSMKPTILAPTNKAFENAGFHSEEDLRAYALSVQAKLVMDEVTYAFSYTYSPLDTILRLHMLCNAEQVGGSPYYNTPMLYNDLKHPDINKGIFNVYYRGLSGLGNYTAIQFPYKLQFSVQNDNVLVQWKSDPASRVPLVRATGNSGIASNGALYKIDQLFYTPQ